MKTLVLSMISIAATVAAMTACTSESDEIDNVVEAPVEIQARAGVGSITTKASMDTWLDGGSEAFFCRAEDNATAADWSQKTTSLFAKIAKNGAITFYSNSDRTDVLKQYYNADASLKSWMIGCHLGGATITGGTNFTGNKATITITGQEDIMVTAVGSGTKESGKNFTEFTFNHLLSNLSFKVSPTDPTELEAVKAAFGDVTKITVSGQPNLLDLTLGATTTLDKNTTPGDATFELAKTVTIGSTDPYGDIMIFADNTKGTTDSPLKIKVYTDKAQNGIDVDVKLGDGKTGLAPKTKYVVTLSFSTTDITATAKVGEWTTSTGEGTVK